MKYPIMIIYLFTITTVDAQVVLDGTLGPAGPLTGPHFNIEAGMGQQMGPNLFHSFEKFNLNLNESATFWGSNTIENVISRVTGGASYIDGQLISNIPNADLYFINPAGIVFGPNALLNIPGSLYISTADYLRLGDIGRFEATEPANSLLTIAPPSAFGFLDNTIGSIEIHDSQLEIPFKVNSNTTLPYQEVIEELLRTEQKIQGDTLAFIGGDITINNGILFSLGGKIQLASLASEGEIPVDINLLSDENLFTKLGKIMITDSTKGPANKERKIANIDVSGFGGGEIFIQAGQLILDNGYIFADTFGFIDGKGITIEVTDDMMLKNAARITTNASVTQYQAQMEDNGNIFEYILPIHSTGNTGNISITANQIDLKEGSQISSASLPLEDDTGNVIATPEGDAGNITIETGKLSIKGVDTTIPFENGRHLSSAILSSTRSYSENSHGGNIKITTDELIMDNLAEIRSETMGFGNAGDIFVEAGRMVLTGGSQIIAGTDKKDFQKFSESSGKGGHLTLRATESVFIAGFRPKYDKHSGFSSNTFTQGRGGTIELVTPQLTIQNNGAIQTASIGEGDAGNILLTVDNMTLQNSKITTEAGNAAGGNMSIQVNRRLDLLKSTMSTEASGEEARDDGGNLTIEQPKFTILDHSDIFTKGYAGAGGNINIVADQFLQTSNSVLDASSQLNRDGEIRIEAPETNIGEDVVMLPKKLVTPKLRNWCETQLRQAENNSRFSKWVNWIGIPRDELAGVFGSFLDLEE